MVVIRILLVIGGVELNPGPIGGDPNASSSEDFPSETGNYFKASALKNSPHFVKTFSVMRKVFFLLKHFISPIYVQGSGLVSFGLVYSEL